MIGIAFMAAAAHAPVILAAHDETQWRRFVRTSLQRPAVAPPERSGSRLRQLQGTVRALADDRRDGLAGPSGL